MFYHFDFIVVESYVLKNEKMGVTQALIYPCSCYVYIE